LKAITGACIVGLMPGMHVDAQQRYAYIEKLLLADFPPPARIVELGSAPGDQIARLASLGYSATSVDIGIASDAWAGAAEGRMQRLLSDAGVRHIEWNMEEVPYPLEDDSFDAVIMTEVYEHLRDYPVRTLQETRRILCSGGGLYFTTPNVAYLMNRFRVLAGRSIATGLDDWIGGIPHARHAREYTFADVDRLMSYAGLSIVRRESGHFHIDSGRGGSARWAKRALSTLAQACPTLGPTIIVVAQK